VHALGDLWYSARSLARQPGLTLALLFTIALGVGSNASVYGFVRGLVTPDLPIPHIDRVVSVFSRDARGALAPVSLESFLALAAGADAFESLGAARESRVAIVIDGRTLTVTVAAVTGGLADLLQLPTADGVVISDRLRRSEFDDTRQQDRRIRIDRVERDVAGVAPEWLEGLYGGRAVDVWTALREDGVRGADRASLTFSVIGRLREGVSAGEAEAALNAGGAGARKPGSAEVALAVVPYTGLTPEAAAGMSRVATLLPATAAAVFLIACANVAAFLLARASARSHETSVRVALGASRGRLARQLLADSAVISFAGGALGVLLAFWTAKIVPALLYDAHAEHLVFSPDPASLVGAAAACGAITVGCGLLPFFELRHDDPAAVLQRTAAGPSNAMLRVRRGLVAVQMACCCVLLISTGLLFEGFRTALRTRAVERLGEPILATVRAERGFERPDLGLQFFRTVEKAAREVPGITTTAWVGTPPGGLTSWYDVRIEPPNLPRRRVELDVVSFTPQSLATVVMPPVAGRMFGGADTPGACKVVILNQAAADVLFGGDAVGRAIESPARDLVEIIGVVAARPVDGGAIRPTVYYYAEQTGSPLSPSTFVVPELPKTTAGGVLDANVVSAGYFGALGLTTTAGVLFRDEPEASRCRTGVINQEASEQYFAGNAVGGAVIDRAGRRTTIVGVIQAATLRASDRRIEPSIYFPATQDFLPRMTLMLGAKESDDDLVRAVQQQLEPIAGGSLIPNGVVTLEAHLSRTALAPERIATVLVGAAAVIALALGAIGIYGAMAEFARQRRREFALRIALGAQRRRVIGQILMTGTRLAAAGIVAGMAGALLVARWLARITPDVATSPGPVWIAGPLVLLAAVALASLIPARRAMMVNPLTIMRDN
jgi:putative ABC transport system permease protein